MIQPIEGRWIARPRKPRWMLPTFLASFLGPFLNVLRTIVEPAVGAMWSWVMYWTILIAFVVFALGMWWREKAGKPMRAADHAMVDGAFGQQYPVEMTTVVDGKKIGIDRGVVWFADGLMGFSGKASSFVLAASDIAAEWDESKRRLTEKHLPKDSLVLVGTTKLAHIVVSPLRGHAPAYRERLRRFVAENESPEGERLWPPLHPYSETPPELSSAVRS